MSFRSFARRAGLGFALLGAGLFHSQPARACGGCFHEPPQPNQNASVVTDHRMAFSISPTRTILWDQIRYQGDPADFAWVLPVGQGAYVELARDEWLGALDALSSPTIYAPPVNCPASNAGGGGFGCGASAANFAGDAGATADASAGGVQVISQNVVGPYEAVTIRSSSGEAISTWLTGNGYAIPPTIQPILDAYTSEGFDFIALKLAPNQGVQAMQPVRVITPGASPTLPLRMVAAGIGSSVGLTLYVVSEGRYEPTNFPSLLVDRTKLAWDPYQVRSNYTQLFDDTVAAGHGWVTEFAGSASQLSSVYKSTCMSRPSVQVPCDTGDAGAADASTDASTDDASAADAAADADVDASSADAGPCTQTVPACDVFDDYDVATQGMLPYDVQITRLRTTLPASALDVDLELGAAADQSPLSNIMTATGYTDPSYDPCGAPSSSNKRGDGCDVGGDGGATVWAFLGIAAFAAFGRRRRARRDA
jgi:MYXO-CTERM domain-containing protein